MKYKLGKLLIIPLLFICHSNPVYSQAKVEQQAVQSTETRNSYKETMFHNAAPKYVKVLEKLQARTGVFGQLLQEVDILLARIPNEGATQELADGYIKLMNKIQVRVANKINLSVFDLPEFYDYFEANVEKL